MVSNMKALVVTKDQMGHNTHLQCTDVPKPMLKSGHCLVQIKAAAINPSDYMNSQGGFPYTKFPRIMGRDYAGVVVEGPSEWLGREVFGTSGNSLSFTEDGAHAEYCSIPESALVQKPKNVSFAAAATIGVPYITASIMLTRGSVTANDTVLVIGSEGAVGLAAAQMAKQKGCKVLLASRSDDSDINIQKDPQMSRASQLTDSRGPDVILDTVGYDMLAQTALSILASRGRYIYISASATEGGMLKFDMKRLYRQEQMIIGCNSLLYSIEEAATQLKAIVSYFEAGQLKPQKAFTECKLQDGPQVYKDVGAKSSKKYVFIM